MFKRLLYYISLLGLVSCSSNPVEQTFRIGFSQCTASDQWRQAMHEEMFREIAFHPELELQIKNAEGNNQQQIADINGFIDQGVDLLIVSPNEAAPITPAVEKAFNQGIPVIVVDRKTSSSLYSAYVGADNYDIGKIAGSYTRSLVKPGDKIIEIWGLEGSTPAKNRHQGFVAGLGDLPLEIIPVYADWKKNTAKDHLENKLAHHMDATVIFAHNDMMALGAYEVAQQYQIADQIKFLGVDGLPGTIGGIQFVMDDILQATFLYPTGGEEAIRIAADILQGKPYQKENILPTTVIDPTNVRILKLQTDKILSQQLNINRQKEMLDTQLQVYQSQKLILYIVIISLVVSISLGAYALYSLKEKKEANKNLALMNNEILRQKSELETMAKKAEEATQAKFRFFTNISHEFRTPLTLILNSVEDLAELFRGHHKKAYGNLNLIQKNAYRLLRLINQLMDFRKIENNKMKLKVSENDMVQFIEEIKSTFEHWSVTKNIDFKFITKEKHLPVWFDLNLMDKVLFNLLSNAFKFTPENGFIHIVLSKGDKQVLLKVEDNGSGISHRQLVNMFDRFNQGDQNGFAGSGLGLALSKEIIHLHGGEIKVQSQKDLGTTFMITLQNGYQHFNQEDIDLAPNLNREDHKLYEADIENGSDEPSSELTDNSNQLSLLIIEDNRELLNFLKLKFSPHYQVITAAYGQEGLKLAIDEIPDLIICDVMLPDKDGLVLAKTLKTDLRTSHIPVILLTAKALEEHQLEGVKAGADMYITKPFNFSILAASIKTLIKNREALKEHYMQEGSPVVKGQPAHQLNRDFIDQFKSVILQNLKNSNLNVNLVGKEMGLSRVQLYRKVKAVLGISVHDYLVDLRLKQAQKLLAETNMTVAEIAYETGFSSPAYFSTAFKNKFGLTPSDYKITH
ncbi:MAG: hybrid sensor histidine kinase/response regulator transcription factor [Candidatus Cyclobacteriaceae bacterium M3_2C_046]